MRHAFHGSAGLFALAALSLALGCSADANAPQEPGPVALVIVSGNDQSGVVGRELPLPLVVKATDPKGNAISKLTVDFKVTGGNGSMYVVATSTNKSGVARNYWTLGTSTAEPQSVQVRTILANGTKQVLGTFNATPLAGPATQIAIQAGDSQIAFIGTPVAIAPAVVVKDQYGNPVPNLQVGFAVITGTGSLTDPVPLTTSTGIATVGAWTLGLTPGLNTLSAAPLNFAGLRVIFTAQGIPNDRWVTRAPMPTKRDGLVAGGINGILYAVGGGDGVEVVGTNESYDPTTDTWTTRSPMPTPRTYAAGVVVGGLLYVIGGQEPSGGLSRRVEVYDPASDTWQTRPPMPTARQLLAVSAVNGIIYAVGGYNRPGQLGILATVEAYDPGTRTWSMKASMPTARYLLGAGSVGSLLYAVGGLSPQSGTVGTLEVYDPATDSWATKAPMLTQRASIGVGVVNGVLFAVGGYNPDTGARFPSPEAYDPLSDSWSTKAPMTIMRLHMGVAVVNGVIYAVGGVDQTNIQQPRTNVVEGYYP